MLNQDDFDTSRGAGGGSSTIVVDIELQLKLESQKEDSTSSLVPGLSKIDLSEENTQDSAYREAREKAEDDGVWEEVDDSSRGASPAPLDSSSITTPSSAPFKSRYGPTSDPSTVPPFTFGRRLLTSEDSVWDYNAWDHVDPTSLDPTYLTHMATQLSYQQSHPVTPFDKHRFHSAPEKFWNKFYANNKTNFFKDRKWLGQEFPALWSATEPGAGPVRVLEVGAGAGNTLFPVLKQNRNEEFHITAADFSATAISLIREDLIFVGNHPKNVDAVVWDIASPLPTSDSTTADSDQPHSPLPLHTYDLIILIFIFSALAPWQWPVAISNLKLLLKPGGTILFRDYGRGDLAQVRMKGGRWLGENFYVRGDGTRVYFFEKDELVKIFQERWEEVGVESWREEGRRVLKGKEWVGLEQGGIEMERTEGRLKITKIGTDRRMLVNRKRQLKMYRCWLQMTCKLVVGGEEEEEEEGEKREQAAEGGKVEER
ncbi:S-adenosyl-L-methionine-dependent methyltransferase [Kalaharituber pfeilii]|nr:S-adenosyl-L-methionine-dependent methyltransferase [Kalaharituber pfeilii]